MRKLLAALALFALCAGSAGAQSVTIQAPWITCSITVATAVTCHGDVAGITRVRSVVGILNDGATQTATGTCYDNNSAASGTVVFNVPALTAFQTVAIPAPGKPVYNGLTCIFSAAPSGAVEFFVR